ncbi:MAG TPA: PAS domain S-box protein [Dongiaceae bacterium]|nr:PAS domain S-box protein [Dongiaceae bacterium]
MEANSTLWKRLWEHDPNGLIVLDAGMKINFVNPAFCRMFGVTAEAVAGQDAAEILGDINEFRRAFTTGESVVGVEREYPRYDLYVRKLIYPIPAENVVAGIFVDLTTEWKQERELHQLKAEAILEVRQVVDQQMRVAQEIAGLLGETTAETKVSLLHLLEMLGEGKR